MQNLVNYSKRLSPLLAKLLTIHQVLPKEASSTISPTASTSEILPQQTKTQSPIIEQQTKQVNPFDDPFFMGLAESIQSLTPSNESTKGLDAAISNFFNDTSSRTTRGYQTRDNIDDFSDFQSSTNTRQPLRNPPQNQQKQQFRFDDDPF